MLIEALVPGREGCAMRQQFLREHAARLYEELTDGRRERPGVGELADRAAERYPGLVPTREQLDADHLRDPADREGLEIDQGAFFGELLRLPETGRHLIGSMRRPTARALELLPEFTESGSMDLGAVRMRRVDSVAQLTVHNEHCLNAETNGHVEAMETAVDLALLDPGVCVGLLRGAPMTHPRYVGRRVFSAGINLADLHEGRISFTDFLLRRELGYINKLYRGLVLDDGDQAWPSRIAEKPWVAAVDGFAIGGGAQLLLVFDHVVAAADSYISLPAAHEGIVPGAAGLRLARLTGGRQARRVILTGRRIWASEPDAAALVDEVVAPSEVTDAADAAAHRLDGPAVVPNRHMLHAAEEPLDVFREYMAEFSVAQAVRMCSPDALARTASFAERRAGRRRVADGPGLAREHAL